MYENLKDYIEKNPDQFKGFEAKKIEVSGDNNSIIEFKKPGTSNGAMTFICINGVFTINGDWGNAVFTWYEPNMSIDWIANLDDMSYIMQKCKASSGTLDDKHMMEWDQSLCNKRVLEIVENIKEEDNEYEVQNSEWRQYTESPLHWHSFLMFKGSSTFGQYWHDYEFASAGRFRDTRTMIWFQGLKEAVKQIREETT